jgi:hypothetical protein
MLLARQQNLGKVGIRLVGMIGWCRAQPTDNREMAFAESTH